MDEQYKEHGAFSWSELQTTDVGATKNFYTQLFGWTTEEMTMPGMFPSGTSIISGFRRAAVL